jgi:hypothetical protein
MAICYSPPQPLWSARSRQQFRRGGENTPPITEKEGMTMPLRIPPRQLEKLRQLLPCKPFIAVQKRATPVPSKTPVAVQRSTQLYIVATKITSH